VVPAASGGRWPFTGGASPLRPRFTYR